MNPSHFRVMSWLTSKNRTFLYILGMLAFTIKDHGEQWELEKVCFAYMYNISIHESTGFTVLPGRQASDL